MSDDNKRLSILDELDKFNTAPQADSLMLGILAEEEAGRAPNRFAIPDEPEAPAPAPDETEPEAPKTPEAPDHYLPLNTSIQDLNNRFDSRIAGIERAIQSLTGSLSQQRQQPQQEQQYQYDPDMPVTGHQMQALAQRQELAYRMGLTAYKNNLATRAHLEYQRFKSANPDFNFDPQQIDFAIDQMARDGKLEQLESTNWRGHFEQMYAPQRQTRYDEQAKQIESLQKELETLKKHSPRPAAKPQPVSPATGRSSRGPAISSPLTESQDDAVVNLKSFRQKGNFKGFARDLPGVLRQGR